VKFPGNYLKKLRPILLIKTVGEGADFIKEGESSFVSPCGRLLSIIRVVRAIITATTIPAKRMRSLSVSFSRTVFFFPKAVPVPLCGEFLGF
jgi:hypothetical protein